MIKKILFCLFLLSAFTLNVLQAQDSHTLAWLQNNQLWIANPEPVMLAENVSMALFSPQQTRLVYVTQAQMIVLLDLTNANSAETIQLDALPEDALIGNLVWQGETLLWMNIFYSRQREGGSNLLETDYELWRLDTTTGIVEAYPQNGVILAENDSAVLIEVGEYSVTPARLTSLESDLSFEYSAVSTGSHLAWLPRLRWTNEFIYTAIPHPDLLYQSDSLTELIQFNTQTGEKQILGEISAAFPADIIWSADGSQIAYISAEQHLILQNVASGEQQILAESNAGTQLLDWSESGLSWRDDQATFHLWSEDDTLELPNIWGMARLMDGYLFLQNSPTGEIMFWQNGSTMLVAGNLNTFEITLVGR